MILENLGPKKKVFEDLEPGDYLFEIAEPGDKGWVVEFEDKDSNGNPDGAKAQYINWRLRVLQPEEAEGRNFFHMTMVAANEEKLAKAKRPYEPDTFTYQFLGDIGAGILQNGEVTVLDDFLTKGALDLNKLIGLRFWGSVRKTQRKGSDKEYTGLTKIWPDK